MRAWRKFLMLLKRRSLERELAEEMRFHLEMKAAELRASGMSAREAGRAALRSFGNTTLAGERSREFWGWAWLDELVQDLRYEFRTLRASRGFTAVAVLILALGIGANTAVFTLLNAVLLRSLPVRNPGQLVAISIRQKDGFSRTIFSYPFYRDLRDGNRVFAGMLGHFPLYVTVAGGGGAELLTAERVTGNYFDVLGVRAARGRTIGPEDDRGHPVCVLSFALWQGRFGADEHILGRTVRLNRRPFTVIGVAPEGFTGTEPGQPRALFIPLSAPAAPDGSGFDDMLQERQSSWLQVLARLAPGMGKDQARAGLQVTLDHISKAGEGRYDAGRVSLFAGGQGMGFLRSFLEKPLLVLMAATVLVLLIACANLATLVTARAAARRGEISVRLALGAGRGRIVRQLLTENLALSVAGGAAGWVLVRPVTNLFVTFLPSFFQDIDASPDWRAFAFLTAAIALVTVLFGLAPALEATRLDLSSAHNDRAGRTRQRLTLSRALVVGQVALSLVLLVSAALLVVSLRNLRGLNTGFVADRVVLMTMNPRLNGYSEAETGRFYERLRERVRSLAGVRAASFGTMVPVSDSMASQDFSAEGYQPRAGEEMVAYRNTVAPGYFETMRIPLLLGRGFSERDRKGAPPVVVVSQECARRYWPGQNPLGKHISWRTPFDPAYAMEVIGVAADYKYLSLREAPRVLVYKAVAQEGTGHLVLHVRTAADPKATIPTLLAQVHALDATLSVQDVKTMAAQVDESLSRDRLLATLSAAFAALALLIGATGLYGVTAYTVERRTREIGVRIALGATSGDVLRLVVGEIALLVGAGLAAGLTASWGATRALRTFLFGLEPYDPASYAGAVMLLAAVALVAAWHAGRRATQIHPVEALKAE
ncbi:MAG TPA: ABC transporter permease [Bryobacteraceae bacterium]|nr:ABC transporter permease [Bryobacteraceae bacterium]